MTIVSAVVLRNTGLTILFVAVQFCALCWYTLSYIPGARACFLATCRKVLE